MSDSKAGCFALGWMYQRINGDLWLGLILGPLILSVRAWPASRPEHNKED